MASVDGTNNFRDSYSPGVQLVLSRELGDHGAVYAAPAYVNNTSPDPDELVDDNDTILIGLGGRFRVRRNTYLCRRRVAAAQRFLAGHGADSVRHSNNAPAATCFS